MKILITGGTGFLGRKLLTALLERGTLPDPGGTEQPIASITLSDLAAPSTSLPEDPRVEFVAGDFTAAGAASTLLDGVDVVFHLAAVVSGQAEADFELGMRVNLDGTRMLLDACRAAGRTPRFLFTSSVAMFGGDLPAVLDDRTHVTPQNSYGAQKAMCELLINDMSRRNMVDGRTLRLPTVVVRPGKPNAAASSFASAVIREPLQGDEYVCPVRPDTRMWVMSPRRVIAALVHAATLDGSAFGSFRAVSLPGLTVSVEQMVDALRAVAGDAVASRVSYQPDPFIEGIIHAWATRFDTPRAQAMGFKADADFRAVVEAFIEDELGGFVA
ncbi:MAG: SDR family oxidoreductase [Gammaproteobacteria bacterium]|nr:SDR family oxidoreductase [Gammaproteobacteria bacterium]